MTDAEDYERRIAALEARIAELTAPKPAGSRYLSPDDPPGTRLGERWIKQTDIPVMFQRGFKDQVLQAAQRGRIELKPVPPRPGPPKPSTRPPDLPRQQPEVDPKLQAALVGLQIKRSRA